MKVSILASGSTGNCTLVSEGETHLLIDAGISARRIVEGLRRCGVEACELSAILITHEHTDHIKGLEVLLRRCAAPVFAVKPVAEALCAVVPGAAVRVCAAEADCAMLVGETAVTPFCVSHDSAGCCGYRISGRSGSFGCCTDLGIVTDSVRAALTGVDCAVIEANHDLTMLRTGPYPAFLKKRIRSDRGHLSNDDAASLAVYLAASGTRVLILGHLSRHNNTPGEALRTVRSALEAACAPEDLPALYDAPETGGLEVEIGATVPC